MIDPVALASALIACPSVTPATGAVFDVLEAALTPLGFTVHRFTRGDPAVENLVALRGSGAPHFGFAGHLDVVPPGEGWDGDAFMPRVEDGLLIGRGANDMKSAIAAFVAAASAPQPHGTLWCIPPALGSDLARMMRSPRTLSTLPTWLPSEPTTSICSVTRPSSWRWLARFCRQPPNSCSNFD